MKTTGCLVSMFFALATSLAAACSGEGGAVPPPFTPADDVQFIDGMVPHHEGAVMMADLILQRGQRSDLRSMAEQMKSSQSQEIEQMRGARQALTGSRDTPPMSDPHMLADMMHMMQLSGAALDQMFLEDMIPHHAGAITMSHRALPNLQRGDMQTLARHIIDSQAREIGELNKMLTAP